MNLFKFSIFVLMLLIAQVSCGKLKLLAFKGPHTAFVGLKVHKPKLLGLKHGFGGFGGGGFGGGFHKSGYEHHEHHEYHESHHSGGAAFGGGAGWLGK